MVSGLNNCFVCACLTFMTYTALDNDEPCTVKEYEHSATVGLSSCFKPMGRDSCLETFQLHVSMFGHTSN